MNTKRAINLPIFINIDDFGKTISLGTIEETNWSLVTETGEKISNNEYLRSIEIRRSSGSKSVKIEGNIEFKSFRETIWNQRFEECLDQGQVNFPIARGIHLPFKGIGAQLCGGIEVSFRRSPNHPAMNKTQKIAASSRQSKLGEDLYRLLNNPDSYHDVMLKCGKDLVPAHKNILSARSPVFAAMFQHDMTERIDGVVNIDDIELHALNAMLVYIYSGKTDDLTKDLAEDLLFAANKYQLDELKQICVEKLESCLSIGNVLDMISLGELLDIHDIELKKSAIKFLSQNTNFSEIQKSEKWISLKTKQPDLALEIAETVIQYIKK